MYGILLRTGFQHYFYFGDRNILEGKMNTVGPVTGVDGQYWGLVGLFPQGPESRYTNQMYHLRLHLFAKNMLKVGT